MKCLILLALCVVARGDQSPILREFSNGNHQFTANVYQEIGKSNSGNFLVSPLSAQTILGLTYAGAGGRTAQQLSIGLHLPPNQIQNQQIFAELNPLLQSTEYYSLSSANKVYVQKSSQIVDEFKKTAVEVFNSEIQRIDFGESEAAAADINGWVEKKTNGKIKDIVGPLDLDAETQAILINALYFHGKWGKPFERADTKTRVFYGAGKQVETEMMEQTDSFNYYENKKLGAKFLEIPYAGARNFISMTFVLPNDKDGLAALENNLDEVFATPRYDFEDVHAVIPKFKIESTTDFKPILQSLGIVDAFNDNADFQGIIFGKPLKVDKVIQKAFIEVEEDGTTASAATLIKLIPLSGNYEPPPPKEFIADHPFIFFIKIQDIVVFAGRYASPSN